MNNEDLKDVKHPICPMSIYFEGDEDKCDTSKCDWNEDGVRSCSQACRIGEKMNLVKWFDPGNVEHLKAYKYLQETGIWPEDFLPKDTVIPKSCSVILTAKIVGHFIGEKLAEADYLEHLGEKKLPLRKVAEDVMKEMRDDALATDESETTDPYLRGIIDRDNKN